MLKLFCYQSALIICLHPCFNNKLTAQSYCAFTPGIKSIYQEIISLNLENAQSLIDRSKDSSDNQAYLLLNSHLFFYRFFILEESLSVNQIKTKRNQLINAINRKGLPMQWQRFIEAELLLHFAMIEFKVGERYAGFSDFYSAVDLLETNMQEYPEFSYSYKSAGIIHALLSGIPESYKWAAKLLGLKGQIKQGKAELERFIGFAEAKQDLFLEESYAAYTFITAYLENKPENAFKFWTSKMGYRDPNPLFAYVQARMAIRSGLNDAAINILQSLPSRERDRYPYLHLLLGICKLNKLDFSAEASFYRYLSVYKGQLHLKESYQKLAWIARLKGNQAIYYLHISKCLTMGQRSLDEDQMAYFEAQSGIIPDSILLRVRLLGDGNYTKPALNELLKYQDQDRYQTNLKLEFTYRLGRINQLQNSYQDALKYFKQVELMDPEGKNYMGSNALLQTAMIYENQGKSEEAITYYKRVLSTNPNLYMRSFHQKAKAGLSRLN